VENPKLAIKYNPEDERPRKLLDMITSGGEI